MPNTYYVDHGLATGNNDGSSPTDAWNDFWEVFDGTLDGVGMSGSYAAGDTIIIRGNGSTATFSTAKSQAIVGGFDAPVTWIVDDGATVTEWIGDSGGFTVEGTVAGQRATFKTGIWDGNGKNLTFSLNPPASGDKCGSFGFAADNNVYVSIRDAKFSETSACHSGNRREWFFYDGYTEFVDCEFAVSSGALGLFNTTVEATVRFIDCQFDMANQAVSAYVSMPNLVLNPRPSHWEFIGCNFINTTPNIHVFDDVFSTLGDINAKCVYSIKDTYLGLTKPMINQNLTMTDERANLSPETSVNAENINGMTNFFSYSSTGVLSWEEGENYPYVNAVLPDGNNTGWSIKAWPSSLVGPNYPMEITNLQKYWNGAASALSVTCEILILDTALDSNDFDNPQKDEWWIEVYYVDNTLGRHVRETSKGSGALESSAASWNTTGYGGNSYDPYKLTLTTSGVVKPNTPIRVVVKSTKKATTADSFYFVCPDVQLAVSP